MSDTIGEHTQPDVASGQNNSGSPKPDNKDINQVSDGSKQPSSTVNEPNAEIVNKPAQKEQVDPSNSNSNSSQTGQQMTPPVQNPSSNNRKPINPPSEVPLSQATNSTQTKNSDQKSVQTPQKTAPAPSKVPPKKVEEKNPLEIQLQQFVFAEQMTSKYKSTVKSLEILFPKIKDIFAKISQGKTKTGSFDGLTKKAAEIGKKSTSDLLGSHSHVSDDFVKDIEGCVEFLQSIDFDPKKMREEVKEECKREYDLKIKQEVAKVKNFKDVAISDRLVSLLQQENKELEEFKASLELKFAVEYKDLFGKELQRLEKQQDFFKVATDNAGYE